MRPAFAGASRMLRTFFLVVVSAAVSTSILAGCGSAGSAPPGQSETDSGRPGHDASSDVQAGDASHGDGGDAGHGDADSSTVRKDAGPPPSMDGGPSAVTDLQLVNQGGPDNDTSNSDKSLSNYQAISWTAATAGENPISHYAIYRNGS